MAGFLQRVESGEILVADGATGTNYQAMGLAIGVAPEEWVDAEPEKVLGLHRAFIEAGADIILTDTFGGTPLRLSETSLATRAGELNRRAAQLARQAASSAEVLVAGSMGPTGMLMEPLGELTESAAIESFAEQASGLVEGGADLLLLETFFALDEAAAAVEGIRHVTDLPLVVTFSFDQGTRTMMGVSPAAMVQAMAPLGVAALGANCGRSLDDMVKVVAELAAAQPPVPLWIKPNAGLPRMVGDLARYETTPETMAAYAKRFIEAGARIVGGCCGTSPDHLRAIAAAARTRPRTPVA
ncbi:MAG TPA: homocysteine S-methyltransferase family protein [Candidatus Dormibacteraeota bacterium]